MVAISPSRTGDAACFEGCAPCDRDDQNIRDYEGDTREHVDCTEGEIDILLKFTTVTYIWGCMHHMSVTLQVPIVLL